MDQEANSDHLQQYVSDRLRSIIQQLKDYNHTQEPEALHELRVDIKKTRAILFFARKVYGQSFPARELKPLFVRAGRIRELQINAGLLNKLPEVPGELFSELKQEEDKLALQFVAAIPNYIASVQRFKTHAALPALLPRPKFIRKYFSRQLSKTGMEVHHPGKARLHQFRKRLKRLMYLYEALPGNMQQSLDLDKTKIDKLQKKLGAWHDTYAAIAFFAQQEFPGKERYLSKLKGIEEGQYKRFREFRGFRNSS